MMVVAGALAKLHHRNEQLLDNVSNITNIIAPHKKYQLHLPSG